MLREILDFLRRRSTTEHIVAMWIPSEACDRVSVAGTRLDHATEALPLLLVVSKRISEALQQRESALDVRQLLRVLEHHEQEHLLDRTVVTCEPLLARLVVVLVRCIQQFEHDATCAPIGLEHAMRAAEGVARELIQQQHQAQQGSRTVRGPMLESTAGRELDRISKLLDDRAIGFDTAKEPQLGAVLVLTSPRVGVTEPEPMDAMDGRELVIGELRH